MVAINLRSPCASSHARCWSAQHRCFVARRDQVLTQATYVLGSYRLASEWLMRPAFGLDKRTPCSLLAGADGYRQVCDLLMRIEYGVY
jgi:putative toxin-antitoxin system antitoxin component (TIGR02293 family)